MNFGYFIDSIYLLCDVPSSAGKILLNSIESYSCICSHIIYKTFILFFSLANSTNTQLVEKIKRSFRIEFTENKHLNKFEHSTSSGTVAVNTTAMKNKRKHSQKIMFML